MNRRWQSVLRLFVREDAPTMAEYGLLLALIALLAFAAVVLLGEGISSLFNITGSAFKGASVPTIP